MDDGTLETQTYLLDDEARYKLDAHGVTTNGGLYGSSSPGSGRDLNSCNFAPSSFTEPVASAAGIYSVDQQEISSTPSLGEDKKCTCKDCGKVFNSVWYLKQHAVKHSSERPFKCKYCHKTYRFRSNLYQHKCPLRDRASELASGSSMSPDGQNGDRMRKMSSSTLESPRTSSESSSSIVNFHTETTFPTRKRRTWASPNGAEKTKSKYRRSAALTSTDCRLIQDGGSNSDSPIFPASPTKHIQSGVVTQPLTEEEVQRFLDRHKDKLHKCPKCKTLWPSREYLTRHMEWHNDDSSRVRCVQCSETFVDEQEYGMHKQSHSPVPLHVCSRCGGKFATRVALKKHSRRCSQSETDIGVIATGYLPALFIDRTPTTSPTLMDISDADQTASGAVDNNIKGDTAGQQQYQSDPKVANGYDAYKTSAAVPGCSAASTTYSQDGVSAQQHQQMSPLSQRQLQTPFAGADVPETSSLPPGYLTTGNFGANSLPRIAEAQDGAGGSMYGGNGVCSSSTAQDSAWNRSNGGYATFSSYSRQSESHIPELSGVDFNIYGSTVGGQVMPGRSWTPAQMSYGAGDFWQEQRSSGNWFGNHNSLEHNSASAVETMASTVSDPHWANREVAVKSAPVIDSLTMPPQSTTPLRADTPSAFFANAGWYGSVDALANNVRTSTVQVQAGCGYGYQQANVYGLDFCFPATLCNAQTTPLDFSQYWQRNVPQPPPSLTPTSVYQSAVIPTEMRCSTSTPVQPVPQETPEPKRKRAASRSLKAELYVDNGRCSCAICNRSFASERAFHSHWIRVHVLNGRPPPEARPRHVPKREKTFVTQSCTSTSQMPETQTPPTFVCPVCQSGFARLAGLTKHQETCRPPVEENLSDDEMLNESNERPNVFLDSLAAFNDSLSERNESVSGSSCNAPSTRPGDKSTTESISGNGDVADATSDECRTRLEPKCLTIRSLEMAVILPSDILRRGRAKQPRTSACASEADAEEKKFKCNFCTKTFGLMRYQRRHERMQHDPSKQNQHSPTSAATKEAETSHDCPLCPKSFPSNRLLKQHLSFHRRANTL